MGFVFKFLLVMFCLWFLLFRLGGFLLKGLLWMMGAKVIRREAHYYQQFNRYKEEEKAPYQEVKSTPKPGSFKGGEYIDYEEVK
jgi:hypothetical protein